jgi:hypothetical protein
MNFEIKTVDTELEDNRDLNILLNNVESDIDDVELDIDDVESDMNFDDNKLSDEIKLDTEFDIIQKSNKQFEEIDKQKLRCKIIELNSNRYGIIKMLVDENHYPQLMEFTMCLTTKYVMINKTRYSVHRYIYYILGKHDYNEDKPVIDHINNNPLDNRLSNLREASISENNRNSSKRKNATSKYFGVHLDKKSKLWVCTIRNKSKNIDIRLCYDKEEHAAYCFDLLMKQHDLVDAFTKLNNISLPNGFIFKEINKKELPTGVSKCGNKFRASFRSIHLGVYNTIEEAEQKYIETKTKYNDDQKEIMLNIPIKRNDNNKAIIVLHNRKGEIVAYAIVDDDKYYDLMLCKWHLNKNEYAAGVVNGKYVLMHRYIKNYTGKDVIDHVNKNKLDNQIKNLKIKTRKQNSQNQSSRKGSSSKYVGVSFNKQTNKWQSDIRIDGKTKFLGYFNTENEAVSKRNEFIETLDKNIYNYPIQEIIY